MRIQRLLRRQNRLTTPAALARTARCGSLDDARIMTFVDLRGTLVGVLTRPEPIAVAAPQARAPLGIITRPQRGQ
jgi:hypothetical protein